MIQNIKRNLILAIIGFTLMNFFMNCSGFEGIGSELAPSTRVSSKTEAQNYTVQSSEQLARSMASVTNVEYNSAITNEYDARKPLMSTDYTLESITAPMLISISNLGSQFCNELIKKESSLAVPERSHFKQVDFSKGLNDFDGSDYNLTLDSLGNKFWGRQLSLEERNILNETRSEFILAIPEESKNSSTQTKNLILSTCTIMLSSFEFITI